MLAGRGWRLWDKIVLCYKYMKSVWAISKVLVLLSVNFPAVMLWLLKLFVQYLWMKLKSWQAALELSIPQSKAWSWEAISEQWISEHVLLTPAPGLCMHTTMWPFQGHTIPSACRELQSRGGGSFCREWFGEKNWISSFWKKSLLGCLVPLGFSCCTPWNLTQTVQAASAKCLCTLQRGSCRGWDRFLLPLGLAC